MIWVRKALWMAIDARRSIATPSSSSRSGESYTVWAMAVPDNYPVPSSALAREQLIKGGYNLAAVLQKIWP